MLINLVIVKQPTLHKFSRCVRKPQNVVIDVLCNTNNNYYYMDNEYNCMYSRVPVLCLFIVLCLILRAEQNNTLFTMHYPKLVNIQNVLYNRNQLHFIII